MSTNGDKQLLIDPTRKLMSSLGAGAVILYENHVLLVSPDYGIAKGHWTLPGGKVNRGEHPSEAAIRETKEETNMDVAIDELLAVRDRILDDQTLDVYFAFRASIRSVPPFDIRYPADELQNAKFWNVDEALKSELVRPMVKALLTLAMDSRRGMRPGTWPNPLGVDDEVWMV